VVMIFWMCTEYRSCSY